MKASRNEAGETVLTLSPEEAHVLIWGGPQDVLDGLEGMMRTALVGVEDDEMSEAEYRHRFDDLGALYEGLRPAVAKYRALVTGDAPQP